MAESDNTSRPRLAVLLVNLGSPEGPDAASVARFLRRFLGDPRVVEIPRLLWWPLLNLLIAPLRARRSAVKYARIWWPEGSPLRVILSRQVSALQSVFDQRYPQRTIRVAEAVSYGKPAIADALAALQQQGIEHIVVLPLYPQYSATSTGSVYDQLADYLRQRCLPPGLSIIRDYSEHPLYIEALANTVREYWSQQGRGGKLLMSFHGIPLANIEKGDPYQAQCEATAQLLARELGLTASEWLLCYQSRLGPAKWLGPDTSASLQQIAQAGCSRVQLICPAFSADCLETLEEIALENRRLYLAAGGEQFDYIPCLNERDDHIAMMAALVEADTGAQAV